MPTSEKKSRERRRDPAEEFFYEDSGGGRQDESLHGDILDQGDHDGAAAVARRVAKRAGLTKAQIDKLGIGKSAKVEKDWDEAKHPRVPAGSSEGGQFGEGGGGDGDVSPPHPDKFLFVGSNPKPNDDRFVQWKREIDQKLADLENEGKAGGEEYDKYAQLAAGLEFWQSTTEQQRESGEWGLVHIHGGPRDSDEPSKLLATVVTRYNAKSHVATIEFRGSIDRDALVKALRHTVGSFPSRAIERGELNVFADDKGMITAAEEAGFRKVGDPAKVAEYGLQRMVWGTEGQTEAEKQELQRQSKEWSDRVLGAAKAVAIMQDYDPAKISVSDQPYHFKIGDKDMTAAGIHESAKGGAITLYPQTLSNEAGVVSVTTHEVAHGKYQKVLDALAADRKLVSEEDQRRYDANQPAITNPDGTLKPEYASQYPLYARLQPHDNTLEVRIRSDGVSDYSKEYWKDYKKGGTPIRTASHETIAEMARIYQETKKLPGSPKWRAYYRDIMTTYDELRAAKLV